MFNILGSKSKVKKISSTNENEEIRFTDSKGTALSLSIKVNGNDTMLCLKSIDDNNEIILDREKAFVLASFMTEYQNTGKIINCTNAILEG